MPASGTLWRPRVGPNLSVALETNGKGFIGFIVELPGAFVRGPTESEALAKTSFEAGSYLNWLGITEQRIFSPNVVQRHACTLMVEDADCEILLNSDKDFVHEMEWRELLDLANFSGKTFCALFDSVELKDWVDQARVRRTFYGENKKTIQEIFDHVKRTQYYYLSRTNQRLFEEENESFMTIREESFRMLTQLYNRHSNSKVFTIDSEEWTLKKILRRFVWHDRIHGKAIARILDKQKQTGLIGDYKDPFHFALSS